jgi:error-prone DNA polymerase
MLVEGELQRSPEGVIHLMASRIEDRSDALATLSQTHDANPEYARADEVKRPHQGRTASHPRGVRIIPKSRDFH